jgi:bifunctional DNA-binding transcriptional regulator/antitoxin component of YhaV-PrlF toxin-antitoxin module
MKTVTTIQVRERGVITLPNEVRERHGITAGDAYQLIDLDGVLVLTPMRPLLPELAAEIARLLDEAGADLTDLLAGLRAERRRLYEERWQPALERDAARPDA